MPASRFRAIRPPGSTRWGVEEEYTSIFGKLKYRLVYKAIDFDCSIIELFDNKTLAQDAAKHLTWAEADKGEVDEWQQ